MKSTLFLIFALFPAFAFAGTYRESRNLEIPAAGLYTLKVNCGAGNLTLQGIEGTDRIKVTAQIEADLTDKEEFQLLADKAIQLELKRSYDEALLVSKTEIPPFTSIESRIHLTLEVPVKMNIRVTDGSGAIEISNIVGSLSIDDDSGAIIAKNITGRVMIKDGSGEIKIEEIQGRLEITDGSGEINVQHVAGDVVINDASGGIEINDISGSVTVSDGSGNIDIYRVNRNVFIREAGSGELDIDGVQGKVTIRE